MSALTCTGEVVCPQENARKSAHGSARTLGFANQKTIGSKWIAFDQTRHPIRYIANSLIGVLREDGIHDQGRTTTGPQRPQIRDEKSKHRHVPVLTLP